MIKECKIYKLYGSMLESCIVCKHYTKCKEDTKEFRNTKINDFGSNQIEIIIYKHDFEYMYDRLGSNCDKSKNFVVYDDPIRGKLLLPTKDETRINKLHDSIFDSSKRAQDSYYGYAFANDWKYFFTLTIDKKKVNDRYNDDEIITYWTKFRRQLQSLDKDVKILCVRERHEDNAIHFHGLIDTAINYNLKPIAEKGKYGDPLFEFEHWEYGRHSLAVLPKDDKSYRAINYLITYTTKQGNIGYCKKRYFRTRNLKYKNVYVTNAEDVKDQINDLTMQCYKDTSSFTIYRNFNVKN